MTVNVIAATKLIVPTLRWPLVARPELCARLDDESYGLAVVSAPAGYGKTATLASWAEAQDGALAWLSCDRADAERTRFMTGLLTASSGTWPGVADDAFVLLERQGADTHDAAIALANELSASDCAGVIVIDDIHLAAPDPQMLLAFADALPAQVRLVIGSRSELPVSLARLRLRGGLLELRTEDLSFSAVELAQFLELRGASLSSDEVTQLHGLTEGWPAGAQLAVLALQRTTNSEQFFEAFAKTDRAMADFLVTEVLDNLPPDLVQFLVSTSVLDVFDADLCAAVGETERAAEYLDRLIAADLFVVLLDERAGWFRYHHLFGAFLRARLATLGEVQRRAVHDRACRALEQRGEITSALRHAMAIDDVDRAGQILRNTFDRHLTVPQDTEVIAPAVRAWLHQFGTPLLSTDPGWILEFLIALIAITGPDDAEWWLQRIERAHPAADGALATLIEGAWAELHLYRGRSSDAVRHASAALDAVGGQPPAHGLGSLAFAVGVRAHLQAGELDEARILMRRASARPVGNALVDEVRHPGFAAWISAIDGDLGRAEVLADSVVRAARRHELGEHEPGLICAGLARAEVFLERNELAAAADVVEHVQAAADASHRPSFRSAVALEQARLSRALGEQSAAESFLTQSQMLLSDVDDSARSVFATEAVHQALRFHPHRAAALVAGLDQDRTETILLRARLALLDDDHREVAVILDALPESSTRRVHVERGVLRALALLDRDAERANGHLEDALNWGRQSRLVRCVIDQGDGVHKLLLSCTPAAELEAYLDELIVAASTAVAPLRHPVTQHLVEPLSPRELTVLRYLSSRLTYQEIAGALYVSLNTLKSHVRSVYRKLAVASRAEAVEAGRRLGSI